MASRVAGLREFRLALKAVDAEAPKALRNVHKRIAEKGAAWARTEASGGTKQQQAAAQALKGSGTQQQASIAISGGRYPFANAAFWGAKRHTGWYAAPRFRGSHASQFPKWVGNSWDTAVAGQGPYAINDALAKHLPDILDEYGDLVDVLAAGAFPERF